MQQKITKILLYAIIILMPTQLSYTIWPTLDSINGIRIDYLAYTIYFTDLLLLGLLISNFSIIPKKISKIVKKLPCLCLLILIWTGFHLIQSTNPTHHLLTIAKISLHIFAGYQLTITNLNPKILKNTYLLQLTLLTTLALLQIYHQGSLNGILYYLGERKHNLQTPGIAASQLLNTQIIKPYTTFSHPNVLSGYITVMSIWYTFSFHVPGFHVKKMLKTSLITTCTLIIFLTTSSQSAWLTTTLITIYHIKLKQSKTSLINIVIITAIIPITLLLLPTNHESITIRNTIFINHFRAMVQNPFFGMGWHGFFQKLSQISTTITIKTLQPVHNSIWFLIGSFGIPLSTLIFAKLYKTISATTINPTTYPLTAIILLSAFDHYWVTQPQTLLLMTFIISQTIKYYRYETPQTHIIHIN